jgi:hypothetical protein
MRRAGRQEADAKLIWEEAYWHHRAEEARTIADQLDNAECKRIMTGIA